MSRGPVILKMQLSAKFVSHLNSTSLNELLFIPIYFKIYYLTYLKHIPIFVEEGNTIIPLLALPVMRKYVLSYGIYKGPLSLHIAGLD